MTLNTPSGALAVERAVPPAPPPPRRATESGGYLPYLVPGLVIFLAVVAAPVVMNVGISFTRWQGVGEPEWVGWDQYQRLFTDGAFWLSSVNNLALILAMAVIPTIVGLLLSAALFDVVAKRHPRTTTALRAAFYLPQVLPAVVAGVVWGWILHPEHGSANAFLRLLGLDGWAHNWLGDENTALLSVMGVLVWIQIGYPLVIFMAGLQRVDPQLYEAAALDGASWWRRLWSISVPQIRPEIFVVLLTCTIAALKSFDKIFVLTGGGPGGATLTPAYYSYRSFFVTNNVGYGAAIATVLAAVIGLLSILFLRAQNRAER